MGFFSLIFGLFQAYHPKKPMTPAEIAAERDRQLKMVTRGYQNKKSEEILIAASRIFALADDDYSVSHSPSMISATRRWSMYLVLSAAFGTDNWQVTAIPDGNNVRVTAQHSSQGSAVTPMFMSNTAGASYVVPNQTPALMPNMSTNESLYELFFARLDYLLGLRTDWLTCKDAKKIIRPD
ncbi:MAG: hypothetical protein IJU79_07440 [Desulfovibrionaceae bacterium]|nr:hypothetical protein [Desulfovibrionaceae bacterium]